MPETTGAALGDRQLFPDLQAGVYLNHAGVSPASRRVVEAVTRGVGLWARLGAGAWPLLMAEREELRAALGRLMGRPARQIALTHGTTAGLIALASALRWRPGDRVLLFRGEFPANVTPWQMAADRFGLELLWGSLEGFDDGSGDGLERLMPLLAQRPRLVALSAVQFQTGLRMPVAQIARLCHEHGALLSVDAIQALGALPMESELAEVDLVATGAHKWLGGQDGCGAVAIHDRAWPELGPWPAGWLSHEGAVDFLFAGPGHLRADRPVRREASFLETGAPGSLLFAALQAGIRPLEELGLPAIFAHVQRLHDALEPLGLERGWRSCRARDPAARSGILSFRLPPEVEGPALQHHLSEAGLACALPDGLLRLAPHWANDLGQVEEVAAILDRVAHRVSRAQGA